MYRRASMALVSNNIDGVMMEIEGNGRFKAFAFFVILSLSFS